MNILVAIVGLAVVFFVFLLFTQPALAVDFLVKLARGLMIIFMFFGKILLFILTALFKLFQAIFDGVRRFFK